MKKYMYFHWNDPNIGYGQGPALIYIKADTIEQAKRKLQSQYGFKHDPDFIRGDVIEVEQFIQPKQIPVI